MAMRRGGTGVAGVGRRRKAPCRGLSQKMVLLGAAKGSGAPVRRWRPEARREVMVPQHLRRGFAVGSPAMDGAQTSEAKGLSGLPWIPAHPEPRASVTQRDRSCAGQTTERGTKACLTGCREAVITYVARFRAPADILCQGGGSGDVHGHDTDGWRRVNAEVCLEGASSSWRTANRRRRRLRVSETIRHPPKRPIADALTFKPAGAHPIHELFAFISSGFK
jgi:hypothetical protein